MKERDNIVIGSRHFSDWRLLFILKLRDIQGLAYSKLVKPLKLGGVRYFRIMRFLRSSERWSSKEIAEYQFSQLRSLLIHAYNRVPYYQKLFKKLNLAPGDFKSIADLQRLPILTKQDMIDNFDELIAEGAGKKDVIVNRTSGSTGSPVKFLLDKNIILYIPF